MVPAPCMFVTFMFTAYPVNVEAEPKLISLIRVFPQLTIVAVSLIPFARKSGRLGSPVVLLAVIMVYDFPKNGLVVNTLLYFACASL